MADRRREAQLELFARSAEAGRRAAAVGPALLGAEIAALAQQLPSGLHRGTSSWSFPGWAGIVYAGSVTGPRLTRSGLAAYARHPLLRSVGIDRSFYAPVGAGAFVAYAAAAPDDFRFLVKAHEDLTLARFPRHPRYGARAGEPSPRCLGAAYDRDAVPEPSLEGLGAKVGAILFQFPPQPSELGAPEAFAERLHGCLGKEVYSLINNKAEGSAPLSAFAPAKAIAAGSGT